MSEQFPAIGHKYKVAFDDFTVELSFESLTSMTYWGVRGDGSLGKPETVKISVRPIRDHLFLVTWQEADKTTVVHLEDYKENVIITHITEPNLNFSIHRGTMTLIE